MSAIAFSECYDLTLVDSKEKVKERTITEAKEEKDAKELKDPKVNKDLF